VSRQKFHDILRRRKHGGLRQWGATAQVIGSLFQSRPASTLSTPLDFEFPCRQVDRTFDSPGQPGISIKE